MVAQVETSDSLRAPISGTRRFSRGVRSLSSAIGVLAYTSVLWLLLYSLAPMVMGWSPTVIGSGSMEPVIRAGDVVLTSDHSGEGLGVGAVIVFETEGARTPVIHRIVDVTPEGAYVTKGDANAGVDSTEVLPSEVKGVARMLVPYAGLPAHWARTQYWPGLTGFTALMAAAVWMAHRRPRRVRERLGPSAVRRWATAGIVSVLLVGATGATAMAAFAATSDNPSSVLTSGSWLGIAAVAGGEEHTCVAMDDGSAYCWGENRKGQLGDGTTTDRSVATRVVGPGGTGYLGDVVDIAAGREQTCAALSDGSAYCWGEGGQGQLGEGSNVDRRWPVQVDGIGGTGTLSGVVEIEAGRLHSCARLSDGTAACWGDGASGKLGDDSTTDRWSPVRVLSATGGGNLSNIADLGLGELHSCAALTDGSAFCWGEGSRHRLGNGSTTDRRRPVQVKGPGGTGTLAGVASIAGGNQHSCVATSSSSALCWGRNVYGKLGIGSTSTARYPTQVLGRGGSGTLSGVSAVSLGRDHSCALHSDGTVSCWGRNNYGQLGDGTTTQRVSPVQVVGSGGSGTLGDVSDLSAGYWHTASVRSGSTGWTWGYNYYRQLGDGTTTNRTSPVQVSGL